MATPHKDEQATPVVIVGSDTGSLDPTASTALADIKAGIDQLNLDSPVLGQATKANSVPVAIASDQDKLGVKRLLCYSCRTSRRDHGFRNCGI